MEPMRSCLWGRLSRTRWLILVLLAGFAPQRSVRAQSQRGGVDIRVVDFDTEEPIFRADVRLYTFGHGNESYRAFTAGPGNVSFPAVEQGNYYIEVTAADYENAREPADVRPGVNNNFTVRIQRKVGTPTERAPDATISAASLAIPAAAQKEYEDGQSSLAKNDTGKSIKHFQKAIALYPRFAQAYAMLVLAYPQQKQPQEAETALTKAISLDSHLVLPRTVLGKLEFERGNFARTEELLLESLRLDPLAWEPQFELGRVYYNLGKLDKSLEFARRAQANPQASTMTHLLLVDIYLRQGDKNAALRELEDFAKLDPKSPLIPRVEQKIGELRKAK